MRYLTTKILAFVLLFSVAPVATLGAECVVSVNGVVLRSNGTSEYVSLSGYDNPPTITLSAGDTVAVTTWTSSIYSCGMDRHFRIRRNGVIIMDVPFYYASWEYTEPLTEPGFYVCEFTGDLNIMMLNSPRFFITTGNATWVALSVKAWLDGAYVQSTGMMHDQLRASGLLPTNTYGTYTTTSVLSTTGTNAIVDWVSVGLRADFSANESIGTKQALIQRDGDVVAMDGVSPLIFSAPPGNYRVVINHRNHLGVMTSGYVALATTPTVVDFRSASVSAFGTDARKIVGTQRLMWAGNAGQNSVINGVSYTGSSNDRDPILVRIGSTTPNASLSGYLVEDVNLDGVVKYTGSGNDRDLILVNVGSTTPNAQRLEQLP